MEAGDHYVDRNKVQLMDSIERQEAQNVYSKCTNILGKDTSFSCFAVC